MKSTIPSLIISLVFCSTCHANYSNSIISVQEAKIPSLSNTLSLQNYLWQPRNGGSWPKGSDYEGNTVGVCRNTEWTQVNNLIHVSCNLFSTPAFMPYSVVEDGKKEKTYGAPWRKQLYKDAKSFEDFFKYKDSNELYNYYVNSKGTIYFNITKSFLKEIENNNVDEKALHKKIYKFNAHQPSDNKIFILYPNKKFLAEGPDPSYMAQFYGKDFPPVYSKYIQAYKLFITDPIKNNFKYLINAHTDVLAFKQKYWRNINNQSALRYKVTLNIDVSKNKQIADAYVVAHWLDGTTRVYRPGISPEQTIKIAIESGESPNEKKYPIYARFMDAIIADDNGYDTLYKGRIPANN